MEGRSKYYERDSMITVSLRDAHNTEQNSIAFETNLIEIHPALTEVDNCVRQLP